MLIKKSQIIEAPASQRLALCPFRDTGGWEGGLAVETEKPQAREMPQKCAAYPPSTAYLSRCSPTPVFAAGGRDAVFGSSWALNQRQGPQKHYTKGY
jgi:hypothetical protein